MARLWLAASYRHLRPLWHTLKLQEPCSCLEGSQLFLQLPMCSVRIAACFHSCMLSACMCGLQNVSEAFQRNWIDCHTNDGIQLNKPVSFAHCCRAYAVHVHVHYFTV